MNMILVSRAFPRLILVFAVLFCMISHAAPESIQGLDSTSAEPMAQSARPAPMSSHTLDSPEPESSPKSIAPPQAIKLIGLMDFGMLLDNLEGENTLWSTRTLWAVKLAPELGILLRDRQGLYRHGIYLGAYGLQNMGETRFLTRANLTAYYAYRGDRWRAYAGIFPRAKLQGEYPLLFFRKDFFFFQPNTNGLALQIPRQSDKRFSLSGEFVFDWYGGNLAKRYDEFFALGELRVDALRLLYVKANALLYHIKNAQLLAQDGALSPSDPGSPDTQLLDEILYNVSVGLDFTRFAESTRVRALERADISLSALGSLERKRRSSALGDFYLGAGGEISAKLQFRGFGIEESYYFGKPQMRYFGEYGESIYNGLPFYQASNLNRLNAYYEYKNDFLRVNVGFLFYTFDSTLALQQMLTLTLDTQKAFARIR